MKIKSMETGYKRTETTKALRKEARQTGTLAIRKGDSRRGLHCCKAPTLAEDSTIEDVYLTAEQQDTIALHALRESLASDILVPGYKWTRYTLCQRAAFGMNTEDLRMEYPEVFRTNYQDILMTAITATYDLEKVQTACGKVRKEHPAMTDTSILLKAYFRTAGSAIKAYVRANKSHSYRVQLNAGGYLPTKEEKTALKACRAALNAREAAEIIDQYEDGEQTVQVLSYIEPQRWETVGRTAVIDPDRAFHGATAWSDGLAMVSDIGALEFETVMLDMELARALESKPADLHLARDLFNGLVSPKAWKSTNARRRTRIQGAYHDILGVDVFDTAL